jgi:DNA topoisomerase IB
MSRNAASTRLEDNAQDAREAGLLHVSDADPGYSRRRAGRGFHYRDANGASVSDARVRQRIRRLAVPPAWVDVWICANPRGHLQATGRDARGRKQYRYHPQWRHARDEGKFARLVEFGERLPRLRRQLAQDLRREGLPREKILATVVSLLAQTLVRVGNSRYSIENGSYGLTTLLSRHLEILRGHARFRFRGKSGQKHAIAVDNARLVRLLQQCRQLPGQLLFQYVTQDDAPQPIDSGMVNDYLRTHMDAEFSAKDFRTWGATLRAMAVLVPVERPDAGDDRAVASVLAEAVAVVAAALGNTAAVCRNSYIHPAVIEGWKDGSLQRRVKLADIRSPRKLEKAGVAFLRAALRHRG